MKMPTPERLIELAEMLEDWVSHVWVDDPNGHTEAHLDYRPGWWEALEESASVLRAEADKRQRILEAFKVVRERNAALLERLVDSHEPERAGRVIGCVRCAKPCALVGDKVPADELCPWCRKDDAPGVVTLWVNEFYRQGGSTPAC